MHISWLWRRLRWNKVARGLLVAEYNQAYLTIYHSKGYYSWHVGRPLQTLARGCTRWCWLAKRLAIKNAMV